MDKIGFDFGDALASITESQNIARKLGSNMLAQRVHSWALRNVAILPPAPLAELMAILTEDA